jgi:hypothetical protein
MRDVDAYLSEPGAIRNVTSAALNRGSVTRYR